MQLIKNKTCPKNTSHISYWTPTHSLTHSQPHNCSTCVCVSVCIHRAVTLLLLETQYHRRQTGQTGQFSSNYYTLNFPPDHIIPPNTTFPLFTRRDDIDQKWIIPPITIQNTGPKHSAWTIWKKIRKLSRSCAIMHCNTKLVTNRDTSSYLNCQQTLQHVHVHVHSY